MKGRRGHPAGIQLCGELGRPGTGSPVMGTERTGMLSREKKSLGAWSCCQAVGGGGLSAPECERCAAQRAQARAAAGQTSAPRGPGGHAPSGVGSCLLGAGCRQQPGHWAGASLSPVGSDRTPHVPHVAWKSDCARRDQWMESGGRRAGQAVGGMSPAAGREAKQTFTEQCLTLSGSECPSQ